jgi:hypothetical protein
MKSETKNYEVYETGIYVGILPLTMEQVRKFTAEAVYVLKAVR